MQKGINMLFYEIREKTGEIPYKKRKNIKEGVTLELEGDSVLIESFVLKEEAIKKLKQFKSEVREMHYSGTHYLVDEYFIEENLYDSTGELISSGDIVDFSKMNFNF